MHDDLLARIHGQIHRLFWLPTGKTLGNDTLVRVAQWQAVYLAEGLPFGRSRASQGRLRKLTAARILTTSGRTLATAHKITVPGMLAMLRDDGVDLEAMRRTLHLIANAEAGSQITLPATGDRLAMCFQIIPEAGPWLATAGKSDAAWRAYLARLDDLETYTMPALALGWLHQHVASGGQLWALRMTAAGRAALADWPAVGAWKFDCPFDAWQEGWAAGEKYTRDDPPPEYRRMLPRRIPASAWCA